MTNEVKAINFDGGELLGVRTEDGKIWLGVKKACMDIGLSEKQGDNEVRKIQQEVIFDGGWRHLPLKFDTQIRKTLVLNENLIPLWVAKISLTPEMQKKHPEAVQKLVSYQLNAANALYEAFMATEEQKEQLFRDLGLLGKMDGLEVKFATVESSINSLIDSVTVNSYQASGLLRLGRERVGELLGGAHSKLYKKLSRMYFKNLWNDFAARFGITTYRDLRPKDIEKAYSFLETWSYI
jgi:hypothetical protein